MIVIISCGARKRDCASEARELYIGSYFRAALAYARSLVPFRNVFILSAKYGLIGLDDVIEPYDLKMGAPGSVTSTTISNQAEILGLLYEQVTVLAGKTYTDICRSVWLEVEAPLEGKGGLGKQISWMRSQVKLIKSSRR